MTALDQVDDWAPPHTAVGWVSDDGTSDRHGRSTMVFELASITKALFAYAILIACEEGTLTLDHPAGPEGSTVRHLLSHASGLGFDDKTGGLQGRLAAVEHRRIYSNTGFDALAETLANASGMTAGEYWREAVAEPLGLASTTLDGSVAFSARSTVDDLLLFAAELLSPTLVSATTLAEATTSQYPNLDGVVPGFGRQSPNPWGLGFEIRGNKSPHWTGKNNSPATFGHFGAKGTMLWVDPVAGLATVCLSDLAFGPWAKDGWPLLSDQILSSPK